MTVELLETKAQKNEQHITQVKSVASFFMKQGIHSSEVVEILKASNYVVKLNGVETKIQATNVAYFMLGYESAMAQEPATTTRTKK